MMNELFCQKCGGLMLLDREKDKLHCPKCGFAPRSKPKSLIIKEKVELGKEDEIEVQGGKKVDTLPKIEEKCGECGNKYAFYWLVQTRSGDEAETRFFECTKCNHRWRDY
jgi:transcription factor S